jgi:hypothetical protein
LEADQFLAIPSIISERLSAADVLGLCVFHRDFIKNGFVEHAAQDCRRISFGVDGDGTPRPRGRAAAPFR